MKRYYLKLQADVELEADTIEDATRVVEDWITTDVDSNDYLRIDFEPYFIKEMTDAKEEIIEDTFFYETTFFKKLKAWFYQGDPYP